jgi:two-component system sensor histidine kinase UhpB
MKLIKVLLVEDNPGDVVIFREMLKEVDDLDFNFVHTDHLQEALQYLRDDDFDVVLLDLNLPDSDGIETFRNVNENAPHLPIIMLTGLSDEEFGIDSVGEGAQDYLVKGLTDSQLLARSIKYSIERKRIERELRESEEKYRLMVEKIRSGVFLLDSKNKLTYVNHSLAKMLGYTVPEMLKKDISNFTDKDGVERIKENLKSKNEISRTYELQLINKNGSYSCVLVSTNPLFKPNGEYLGAISILTDISSRKSVEKSLINALKDKDRDFFLIMGNMVEAMKPLIQNEYKEEYQDKFA